MLENVTHIYTGTKACGCTVAAVVDEPSHQKDTAKAVADFIKHGYTVERVPIGDGLRLKKCDCAPKPLAPEVLELFAATGEGAVHRS